METGSMTDNHKIKELRTIKVVCSCNWFYEDEGLYGYGPSAGKDKLLDVHNGHVAYIRSFKCVECGQDRRNHPTGHVWRIE